MRTSRASHRGIGAQRHGQQCIQLALQIDSIDTPAVCGAFLARLKLAQGDVDGANALLAEADDFACQHNYGHRLPEVAAIKVLTLLHRGDLVAAAGLAEKHDLPMSQARVQLAKGEAAKALATLEPVRQQVEEKGHEEIRRLEALRGQQRLKFRPAAGTMRAGLN